MYLLWALYAHQNIFEIVFCEHVLTTISGMGIFQISLRLLVLPFLISDWKQYFIWKGYYTTCSCQKQVIYLSNVIKKPKEKPKEN